MRRLLIIFFLIIGFFYTAKAQINDGINQPTKIRIMMPAVVTLDGSCPVVVPFVSYRYDFTNWLNIVPRVEYNINTQKLDIQALLGFEIKDHFYIISRSIFDVNDLTYHHCFATTIKLPYGFILDTSWDNAFYDGKFCEKDRFQVVAGLSRKYFVFNIGYSMLDYPGLITNLRVKFTKYNWMQFKYDSGLNAVSAAMLLQFDDLW